MYPDVRARTWSDRTARKREYHPKGNPEKEDGIMNTNKGSKITVADLVRGSEEINRMKQEIKMVVGLLISQRRELGWKWEDTDIRLNPDSPERGWILHKGDAPDNTNDWVHFHDGCIVLFSSKNKDVSLMEIEVVFNSLQILIDGMVKAFPFLPFRLAPLVSTARQSPAA